MNIYIQTIIGVEEKHFLINFCLGSHKLNCLSVVRGCLSTNLVYSSHLLNFIVVSHKAAEGVKSRL